MIRLLEGIRLLFVISLLEVIRLLEMKHVLEVIWLSDINDFLDEIRMQRWKQPPVRLPGAGTFWSGVTKQSCCSYKAAAGNIMASK